MSEEKKPELLEQEQSRVIELGGDLTKSEKGTI